jgi:PKD repeat protein
MAEQTAKSIIPGWLKAVVSSIFGLASGAVLMYVTPLVNHAVKPAEPIANFGYQAQGLAVTFQNRSSNATDGWWDFGDGSALEPFSPQQPTIAHTYTKPGSYTVKLGVSNLFSEKNERDATVNVDGAGAPQPVIDDFQVTPLSPGMPAPAVFHLTAKVKNADQIVWVCGDRPIEVSTETGGVQDRWVTIDKPGHHTFRVVAVSGKQTVEKISPPQLVSNPAAGGAATATLSVSYDAVHVEHKDAQPHVRLTWKHDCRDSTCPATVEWTPWQGGWQIIKAEYAGDGKDKLLHGTPRVEVAPGGSKVVVSAEMARPAGMFSQMLPPVCHVPLKVTLEKRSVAQAQAMPPLQLPVRVPGQTTIPIPPLMGDWQATSRKVTLDLADGNRKLWSGSDMPVNRPLQLRGHPVVVSAMMQNNQIVLTVTNPPPGLPPAGN